MLIHKRYCDVEPPAKHVVMKTHADLKSGPPPCNLLTPSAYDIVNLNLEAFCSVSQYSARGPRGHRYKSKVQGDMEGRNHYAESTLIKGVSRPSLLGGEGREKSFHQLIFQGKGEISEV